jgi:para-nitrobenzyl esterase
MAITQTIVRTAAGEVSGTGTGVRVYRGIPYAAPPVGPLRWRAPQPVQPWTGVRDGSTFGPDPIQVVETNPLRLSLAPGTSEDCLTLNVWAPAEVPAQGAPVVVWFDGGGFVTGSASRERIEGSRYAQRGAIFVAANYRVGVFGFLAHPLLSAESPHGVSGNYGFLDAIAALKWVRENIAAFGGDPKRVTTFGGSAGAALGALLLTSPLAKGLIDGAIMVSPGSFRPLRTLAEAEQAGTAVGDDLAAMRALPAAELLAKNAAIDPGLRGLLQMRRLRPIVDGWAIERDEVDAYRGGTFAAVPTIIGTNANEGGFFQKNVPVTTVDGLRTFLSDNFGAAHAAEAWNFYGATSDAAVPQAIADVFGDAMFNYGVRGTAREIARRQPKTFRYVLTHVGAYTADPPTHADDIAYVFGTGELGERDRAVSDAIVSSFVNFAAGGDPNGAGAPHWPAYDPQRDNYLTLGGDFREGSRWRSDSVDFIDRYYRDIRA